MNRVPDRVEYHSAISTGSIRTTVKLITAYNANAGPSCGIGDYDLLWARQSMACQAALNTRDMAYMEVWAGVQGL